MKFNSLCVLARERILLSKVLKTLGYCQQDRKPWISQQLRYSLHQGHLQTPELSWYWSRAFQNSWLVFQKLEVVVIVILQMTGSL